MLMDIFDCDSKYAVMQKNQYLFYDRTFYNESYGKKDTFFDLIS